MSETAKNKWSRQRHSKRDSLEWQVQLLALGVLLGNRKLRDRVEPGDFADWEMAGAVESLKNTSPNTGFACLERVLQSCGVEWKQGEGQPIEKIVERLRLDAEFRSAFDWVRQAIEKLDESDEAKRKFVDKVRNSGKFV